MHGKSHVFHHSNERDMPLLNWKTVKMTPILCHNRLQLIKQLTFFPISVDLQRHARSYRGLSCV